MIVPDGLRFARGQRTLMHMCPSLAGRHVGCGLALACAVAFAHGDAPLRLRDGRMVLPSRLAIAAKDGHWHLERDGFATTVFVSNDARQAPRRLSAATLSADGKRLDVTFSTVVDDQDVIRRTLMVDQLEALHADALGARREKRGDRADAVANYDKACLLAPDLIDGCIHAAALRQATNAEAAWVAVARALAVDALAVYERILSEPRLAPLLARPELAAMRSATPGQSAVPRSQGAQAFVAYSEKYDAVAIFANQLYVYSARTGKLMTIIRVQPEVDDFANLREEEPEGAAEWRLERQRAARVEVVRQRVNVWLRDLGFSPLPQVEVGIVERDDERGMLFVRFPASDVYLSCSEVKSVLRVRRAGKILSERNAADGACFGGWQGWLSPLANVVVATWGQRSGSDDFPYKFGFEVVPLGDARR